MIMVTMEYTICKAVDLMTAGTFLQPLARPPVFVELFVTQIDYTRHMRQARTTQKKLNGRARSCGDYKITIVYMSSN